MNNFEGLPLITIYFIVINLLGFLIMGIDKYKAKRRKMRISEQTIWLFAILGGTLGVISGMYYFRHKTNKNVFKIGLPVIILIQLIVVFYWNN